MRKFKFFIDYTKEEKWLREMANKGYKFISRGFGYKFIKSTREDIVYKIDYRTFKEDKDFMDYCTIFEDSGWKHVFGVKCNGSQYFEKVSNESSEDIFSDNISKASRYKRLSDMWVGILGAYIPLAICLLPTCNEYIMTAITNPKNLYYTPGLWETNGLEFIGKFLFETPFVILRVFPGLLLVLLTISYIYFSYKSKKLYKLTIQER